MTHQTGKYTEEKMTKYRQDLFEYAMKRKWPEVVRMYKEKTMTHSFTITKSKDTALHVAVFDGQEDRVKELVDCVVNNGNKESLKLANVDGNTPLHLAAAIGSAKMCLEIVREESSLVEIPNNAGETPFFLAASYGKKKAFLQLHYLRELGDEAYAKCRRNDGETILSCAIDGEFLDLAYQIINLYPDLVHYRSKSGLTALHYLARKPTMFRSGCHIGALDRILYYCTFVDKLTTERQKDPVQALTMISNVQSSRSNSPDVEAPKGDNQKRTPYDGERAAEQSRLVPDKYVTCCHFAILVFKAMLIILTMGSRFTNKMHHLKRKHTWSIQIIKELVKRTLEYEFTGGNPIESEEREDHTWPYYFFTENSSDNVDGKQTRTKSEGTKKTEPALLLAAKNGVAEMVEGILKKFPLAISDTNEEKKNAVLLAVVKRHLLVYKLLLDWGLRQDVMFGKVDKDGNSVLHLAANLVGTNSPWITLGPALQMMLEIKWYEYIRDSNPVYYFTSHNINGESPNEVFTKTHKDLLKSGGEWLTKISESCSVVAALIATFALTTSATVPGGNDQLKGTPVLVNSPIFGVFAIGSLFSLGSSITSLVMFLAILTSRYQENDFRTNLPWKLLLAFTLLFMSIGATLTSFCAGHFVILKENLKYAAFPIYALTCLPVSFFAVAQFSLYFDIMRATFSWRSLYGATPSLPSTQLKPADDQK